MMLVAQNNGDIVINERTKVPLRVILAVAGILLAGAAGWFQLKGEVGQKLDSAVAAHTYVTRDEYQKDYEGLCQRLERIEDKIDRLMERNR